MHVRTIRGKSGRLQNAKEHHHSGGFLTGYFQISACRHTHNQTRYFDVGQGEGFYKPVFIRCYIDEILPLVGQPFLRFMGVLAGRVTGRG